MELSVFCEKLLKGQGRIVPSASKSKKTSTTIQNVGNVDKFDVCNCGIKLKSLWETLTGEIENWFFKT